MITYEISMIRIKRLIINFVLPISILLFGTITKWQYVAVIDGPNEFIYGFPFSFICSGWHTSMSLQIFVLELFMDFSLYFIICLALTIFFDRYLKQMAIPKIVKYFFYCSTLCALIIFAIVLSNSENIIKLKKDFDYEVIKCGYKFIWQKDQR